MSWMSDAIGKINPRLGDAYEKWEQARDAVDNIKNVSVDSKLSPEAREAMVLAKMAESAAPLSGEASEMIRIIDQSSLENRMRAAGFDANGQLLPRTCQKFCV